MTKALLCLFCSDIVAPRRAWQTDRSWRWCDCGRAAVRWRDGDRGLLEVTSRSGADCVRVIGFNNAFLGMAVYERSAAGQLRTAEQWRKLHEFAASSVGANYLFHQHQRDCWAVVFGVGQTGDVTFVEYDAATAAQGSGSGGTTGSGLEVAE